ncbi:phenylacetate--CoA ligase family protein [Calderihabitans maritimus]|uniref:Phenylacetate--CoA ligase n=1 Tax=Calderihabitans maritimus TaxID=1246530 RepID=A0A1Z5HW90_9FIRM|nr:AMP-binding protein [Calderihabitans maritimus]GAW93806.1 phenylacetate--CoA ligase [Calderihabitans maritimus]
MYLPFLGREGKIPPFLRRAGRKEDSYNKYWNPYIETLSLKEIREISFRKLQAQLKWLYENNKFYRQLWDKLKISPDDIKTPDDVRRLPIMTRRTGELPQFVQLEAELERLYSLDKESPNYKWQYGDFCTWGDRPELLAQHRQTSGTTGGTPARMGDTMRDWEYAQEGWCIAHWAQGIRPYDMATWFASYGLFIMWVSFYSMEKMGAQMIPAGGMDTKTRINMLTRVPITVLCTTPTYAAYIVDVAEEMGVDLREETSVRIITMAGEPLTQSAKKKIETGWGARAYDTYGSTETGLVWTFECADDYPSGNLHVIEDLMYVEVLDPNTLEPVKPGELGEAVITHLGRSSTPVVRFRTHDLVRVTEEPCKCGRGYARFIGGVLGRSDDMFKVKGTMVFPSLIENVVRKFKEVDEFQVIVEDAPSGVGKVFRLIIDPHPSVSPNTYDELKERIRQQFRTDIYVRPEEVEIVAPGSLPRFEQKAKRITFAKKEK